MIPVICQGAALSSVRDHPVISETQQTFPAADGEGQDAFQPVMFFLVRPVHHSRHQAEAAGVVCGLRPGESAQRGARWDSSHESRDSPGLFAWRARPR